MTPLDQRLILAKQRLTPVDSKYCVAYEDPAELDAPVKIFHPDPHFLAAALAGWVLSPVDTYLRDQKRKVGEKMEHPYAPPIPAMSEEETLEYLIKVCVPTRVWRDYTGNRTILKIVPKDMLPADYTFRDAWSLAA